MKRLKELSINDCVFIDIETTQIVPKLEKGTDLYDSWVYKLKYSREAIEKGDEKSYVELFDKQAALYPEFAKIIVITIGKIVGNELKMKSFYNNNEEQLLKDFNNTLNNIVGANKNTKLVGHYITQFDIPFIAKRCIVNQVEICDIIDVAHLKSWNYDKVIIDTCTLWQGGSRTSGSLINIAVALGLENPKNDIAGYEVSSKYFSGEADVLERIARYCEKDVFCVASVFRKCRYEPPLIKSEEVVETEVKVPELTRLFNGGKYSVATAKKLTSIYSGLNDKEKEAMQLVLKALISSNTNFTDKHLEAITNHNKA